MEVLLSDCPSYTYIYIKHKELPGLLMHREIMQLNNNLVNWIVSKECFHCSASLATSVTESCQKAA
jgi:excinuclease UvrABC nuclease subunit